MSCPRDIRPNEDDAWGYGDLHGTEEYPSISLLTGRCKILFAHMDIFLLFVLFILWHDAIGIAKSTA